MWLVVFTDGAASERLSLPAAERNALLHAVEKLEAFGPLRWAPRRRWTIEGSRRRRGLR